jgi:Cytochrome P450
VNESHHGAELTEQEAAADASLLIASSLETTSQAITTLFRYVVADEAILNRLRTEIDSVVAVDVDEIDISSLMELTYLDACVQEALRIVPPAPSGTSAVILPKKPALILVTKGHLAQLANEVPSSPINTFLLTLLYLYQLGQFIETRLISSIPMHSFLNDG